MIRRIYIRIVYCIAPIYVMSKSYEWLEKYGVEDIHLGKLIFKKPS